MNMAREVAALRRMTVKDLRRRYAEVFGETTRSGNKDWLWKRIAWRIQANAEGDLTERARRRAEELAKTIDLRLRRPPEGPVPSAACAIQAVQVRFAGRTGALMPGTVLARPYKGRMVTVTVLDRGFEYEGDIYRSLSAVARAATGSHWNGRLFFGLRREA